MIKIPLVFSLLIYAFPEISNVTTMKAQQQDSLVAPGATLQKISSQFSFTEGASVDKKGNVFFTDQPNDKIWKYDLNGHLSVFMDKTGRSNGTYFDHKGNLLTCADENNEIWSIDSKGKITVVLKDFEGHHFNGPNDLWEDLKGGIYLTDPYYQRPYWKRTGPEINGEKVYYLPKGKKKAFIVADDLQQPNGIVGTPDGKFLYVADIKGDRTYKYKIDGDGTLSGKQLFCNQGSDGMTLDNRGNVYLTGSVGVTAYNMKGEKIKVIEVPSKWTANLCFGGKKKNILFITASESVYTIEMNVHGVE
jgi:gluconolactonase